MSRTLIVGSSKSGKSTLAKKLAKEKGLPVYVLMCYEDLGLNQDDQEDDSFRPATWESVKSLKDSCVIVEDLMTLSREEEKSLRHLLDYFSHHSRLHCFVCCHHVQGIGIYPMLSSFQAIMVTLAKSNLKSLDTLLLYFKFPEADRKKYTQEFVTQTSKYGFVKFDAATREITFHGEDEKVFENDAKKYFAFFKEPLQAEVLFNLVYAAMPKNLVRARDHCVQLENKKTRKIIYVSMYDYVYFLSTEKRPSENVLKLHKVIKSLGIIIPTCMIKNAHMQ